MKLKNQIVNYFVVPPHADGQAPRVFTSPVTMNAEVGKKVIEEQLRAHGDKIPNQSILHVCFDLDSTRIYLPNASSFSKDKMQYLLQAAKIKILKDHGDYSNVPPIEGSPFSSIRVRSVSSFGYTMKAIQSHFPDNKFVDLPVIEASLGRMPSTIKTLPSIYRTQQKFVGSYISSKFAPSITFWDEKELSGQARKEKVQLLTQKTPFILIDITPAVESGATEKEWTVLSGYRDFLYDQATPEKEEEFGESKNFNAFADLYAVKRHLYLGWPFAEICVTFLEHVNNFGELVNGINALVQASGDLAKEGYDNPARIPYYMTFKIDMKTFPLRLESMMSDNNTLDPFRQLDNFRIIEFDQSTGLILIETPAFISPELCRKVLRSVNRPLITHYNPAINTIDVKSPEGTFRDYQSNRSQLAKISALTFHDIKNSVPNEDQDKLKQPNFRDDHRSRDVSMANSNVSHIRKVSEYFYAADHIKKMCKERGLEFKDVDVVVGPIERIFGRGIQGGFMGEKQWKLNKLKIPHELEKGLSVSPPIIAINSATMPSYAKQTDTLIHEYSHNLYSITNSEHEHLYNKDPNLRKKDELQWWQLYFDDPDERLAHKEEIKHELISGRSVDEIIRDKIGEAVGQVGKAITLQNYRINYPIALKFRELVQEAASELERENEQNEEPLGTST